MCRFCVLSLNAGGLGNEITQKSKVTHSPIFPWYVLLPFLLITLCREYPGNMQATDRIGKSSYQAGKLFPWLCWQRHCPVLKWQLHFYDHDSWCWQLLRKDTGVLTFLGRHKVPRSIKSNANPEYKGCSTLPVCGRKEVGARWSPPCCQVPVFLLNICRVTTAVQPWTLAVHSNRHVSQLLLVIQITCIKTKTKQNGRYHGHLKRCSH